MWYLPYERLTLKSSLRPEDAALKLTGVVEPKLSFRWPWSNNKPYQGSIDGFRFSISRILYFRSNSFLPMITGEIRPDMGGCSIQLSMAPRIWVSIFMAFWLGFVGLVSLLILGVFISGSLQPEPSQPFSWFGFLIVPGMFIFGYGLLLGGFKFESVRSKAFFRELFQAYQVIEFGETDIA